MIECIRNERLNEQYECIRHSSGLSVLLFQKKCVTTYATLVIRYGAQDTSFLLDGIKHKVPDGTAHFLEHKMFARPDGGDANELFSALGADANAWTSYDKTAYLFSTSEPADGALTTLIEFVSNPYFTRENVAKEKGIIREEIAMGEDDPWQRLYEQSMQAAYHRHGVRRKICGSVSSIGRITPAVLNTCYNAFYRPDNAYLIICGDITMSRVMAAIDEPLNLWHERMREFSRATRLGHVDAPSVLRKCVCKTGEVSRPIFRICWKDNHVCRTPYEQLMHETGMNILSEMLFCRSAKFYDDLFEAGKIAPSYSYGYSSQSGLCPLGYHSVEGEADNAQVVFSAYEQYLEDVRRNGLQYEDFERMRRVLYAGFVSQFDFPDDIADLMCDAFGDGRQVFDVLKVLENITFEQVQSLFDHSFDMRTTVFSTIVPEHIANKEELDV